MPVRVRPEEEADELYVLDSLSFLAQYPRPHLGDVSIVSPLAPKGVQTATD